MARLRNLGPGLVTGCADDDPSGIATYSQAGAQFGTQLLWGTVLTFPLMVCVQEISARIGQVTGIGLAGTMRRHYSRWLLYPIVFLLTVVNVINIGADIGAMGAATALLLGNLPFHIYAIAFGITSVLAQVFIRYAPYSRLLKWLSLATVGYIAVAFTVRIPWEDVLHHTVLPTLSSDRDYWLTLVGVLGTTISPYLFFWQSSQEVEEQKMAAAPPLSQAPCAAPARFRRIRFDTITGMAVSNLVAYFIILTAAVSLHGHGVTQINSAADAAKALEPVAGRFAFLLFSLCIIGTGLLAVPVLAGSAGYAAAETFSWPIGLDRKAAKAKAFYAFIAVATLVGTLLNFLPVDPIRALFWSAVLNGLLAVPVLIVLLWMGGSKKVMGGLVVPRTLRIGGWITTALMAAAAAAIIVLSI